MMWPENLGLNVLLLMLGQQCYGSDM